MLPCRVSLPCARIAEGVLGGLLIGEYRISNGAVTAMTTDTAANQKNAIMQHTQMQWLPCICHVLELVMGILVKEMAEVRGTAPG